MSQSSLHPLEQLLRERIVILDGAMGTNVQTYKLEEAPIAANALPRITWTSRATMTCFPSPARR